MFGTVGFGYGSLRSIATTPLASWVPWLPLTKAPAACALSNSITPAHLRGSSRLTPIKAIREKCLDRSGGSRQEARPLWLYRLDKRPKQSGFMASEKAQSLT